MIPVRVDFHDRRSPSWQLFAGALLALLLVALAVLQYRWLGEVGEAERARMRASLQTRAADFTQAFDRELTRIYLAFDFDPDTLDKDAARAVGTGLESFPDTLLKLFRGENFGKLILGVEDQA